MRRILLLFIILLVVILGITAVFKGTRIGTLKISSVSQIGDQNKKLDSDIAQLNNSIQVQYPAKLSELKTASQNMQDAKDEYLNETNKSTNDQILEAMQQKNYRIEFLWVRLETHAREQSVVLKFEIVPSSLGANTVNDIKFTVNGTYNNTIRFITALENDTDLNFKIENFKMQPTDSGKMGELLGIDTGSGTATGELRYIVLESTFNVRNITIEDDTLSKLTSDQQATQTTTSSNNTSSETATTETTEGTTQTTETSAETTETTETTAENTETTTDETEGFEIESGESKTAEKIMQEF